MAQYAMEKLKLKLFGILAPTDVKIMGFVRSFENEVLRNGGRVVFKEWYSPDEKDIGYHIRNIKTVIESLRVDTVFLASVDSTLLDSTREDTAIVGLYCPISSTDFIGIIPAQVYYYALPVKILGNDMWNDFNELYYSRDYTDGILFTSVMFVDVGAPEYMRFKKLYENKYNIEPDEYAIYGYDTARMILKLVESGVRSRAELYRALKETSYFGIGMNIRFNSQRLNTYVNILTFKNGSIEKAELWHVDRAKTK